MDVVGVLYMLGLFPAGLFVGLYFNLTDEYSSNAAFRKSVSIPEQVAAVVLWPATLVVCIGVGVKRLRKRLDQLK